MIQFYRCKYGGFQWMPRAFIRPLYRELTWGIWVLSLTKRERTSLESEENK